MGGTILDGYIATKKTEVMQNTFGHLYPKPLEVYVGTALVVYDSYGGMTLVFEEFKDGAGKTLCGADILPSDLLEYITRRVDKKYEQTHDHIYRFTGTYKKFKNGNFQCGGKITRVNLNKILI